MTEELLNKMGDALDAIESVIKDETTEKFIVKEMNPPFKELCQIYDDYKDEFEKNKEGKDD